MSHRLFSGEESRNLATGFSLSGDVPLKTLKAKAQDVEKDLVGR
ncbi:MAG: hypothetical protein R3B47_12675 [Bacteroidia bacterium]